MDIYNEIKYSSVLTDEYNRLFLSFVIFCQILPGLTYNGSQPLNVNAGRILPGFGRKLGNIAKLE